MTHPELPYFQPLAIIDMVGVVTVNSLVVAIPIAFAGSSANAVLPLVLVIGGSGLMSAMELRQTANRTEYLTNFGAYQYASLAGAVMLLLTKWSGLTECLLGKGFVSPMSIAMGSLVFLTGCCLRSMSIRALSDGFCSQASGRSLVTNRVFSIFRHPSETGLLLVTLGLLLILGAWRTALVSLPITLFLSVFRMRLEERELLATFGNRYQEYCYRTGRWLPNVRRWKITDV